MLRNIPPSYANLIRISMKNSIRHVINIFTRKNQIDTMKGFAMNTFHYKKQFFALYSNT